MNRLTKLRVQRKGENFTLITDLISPSGKRIKKFAFRSKGRQQFQKDLEAYLKESGIPWELPGKERM